MLNPVGSHGTIIRRVPDGGNNALTVYQLTARRRARRHRGGIETGDGPMHAYLTATGMAFGLLAVWATLVQLAA